MLKSILNQLFDTLSPFLYRKKHVLFSLFLGSLCISLPAQKWQKIDELNEDALLAFYEYRFSESAHLYENILQDLPNSHNFAFLAAIAHFASTENIRRAVELLEFATQNIAPAGTYNYSSVKELRAPTDALYFLGRSYLVLEQYEKAEQALKSFIEKSLENDELISLAKHQLKCIPQLKNKSDISPLLKFENLKELNNDKPNLFPVISGDKSTIAFTVPLEDGLNIFISTFSNKKWTTPRNITWDIAGGVYKTAFLSYNGKELYLINENPPQQIVYTKFIDGEWTLIKKVKKPINGSYAQASVAITKNGRTMYFTSDRPGGFGGFDIYVSTLDDKGKWSKPINLGDIVNTPFNEEFVMLSPDEELLFFSSEGHENFGGADIFVWELGTVNPPQNLGFPINNAYTNNFFYPIDRKAGLVSLAQPNGLGSFDIYRVTIQESYPVIVKLAYDPAFNIFNKVSLELTNIQNERIVFLDPMEIKSTLDLGYIPVGRYKLNIFGSTVENFSTEFEIKKQVVIQPTYIHAEIKSLYQPAIAQDLPASVISPTINTQEELKNVTKNNKPTPLPPKPSIESTTSTKQQTFVTTPNEVQTSANKTEKLPNLPQKGQFTIQIMALELPLTINETLKIGDVNIFYSETGYYLHTTGFYETKEEAGSYLAKIREQYPSAFIRKVPESAYVIQLMALKQPKDLFEVGKTIDDISMVKGSDGFYRYFIGGFKTKQEAEAVLSSIRGKGFPDAWIRKIPTQ